MLVMPLTLSTRDRNDWGLQCQAGARLQEPRLPSFRLGFSSRCSLFEHNQLAKPTDTCKRSPPGGKYHPEIFFYCYTVTSVLDNKCFLKNPVFCSNTRICRRKNKSNTCEIYFINFNVMYEQSGF